MTASFAHVHPLYGARKIADILRDLVSVSLQLRAARAAGSRLAVAVTIARADRLLDQLLDATRLHSKPAAA